jgi:putative endonuclease
MKDGKLYIGQTNNLVKRIKEHNKGLVVSTKNRKPFKLIYYEGCNLLQDSLKREDSLKTGFGRAYLKRRLKNF